MKLRELLKKIFTKVKVFFAKSILSKSKAVIYEEGGFALPQEEDLTMNNEIHKELEEAQYRDTVLGLLSNATDEQKKDMQEALAEVSQKTGISANELVEALITGAKIIREAFEQIKESVSNVSIAMQNASKVMIIFPYHTKKEKVIARCKQEKKKMPNNKRKRKKKPMMRTQAYVRALKNRKEK